MDSRFIEAICLATVEILGEKDTYLILKEIGVSSFSTVKSKHFSIAQFGYVLAERYSPQVAMGLMIRIGRASLTFLRRFFPDISKLGGIDNRLKPVNNRFPYSLDVIADLTSKELNDQIEVISKDDLSFEWRIRTNNRSFTPYYHFGLLEEFCYWLDARKDCQIIYASDSEPSDFAQLVINIKDME